MLGTDSFVEITLASSALPPNTLYASPGRHCMTPRLPHIAGATQYTTHATSADAG